MTSDELLEQIGNNFTYHKPFGDQPKRYALIRDNAAVLAQVFALWCPESRERSLAITSLEQAVMWANASIARNMKPEEGKENG